MCITYALDQNQVAPFEIGAILLSILAFPGVAEKQARERAAEALCANVLRETVRADPIRAAEWWTAYQRYSEIDLPESRRRLRTFPRRLRDRMIASRMSLGFFEEGITKVPAKLPPEMARLSLNELSKLVQSQSNDSDPENIERRAWRESRPVIHIASAMQVILRRTAPDEAMVGYPLDNSELHVQVIALAQLHESIVLSDRRFGVSPDQIIRIRSNSETSD